MKDAVRTANDAGVLGTYLNQLFQKTFSITKANRIFASFCGSALSLNKERKEVFVLIADELSYRLKQQANQPDAQMPGHYIDHRDHHPSWHQSCIALD